MATYSLERVPEGIYRNGQCATCGLFVEPDEITMEVHECPPSFQPTPSKDPSKETP